MLWKAFVIMKGASRPKKNVGLIRNLLAVGVLECCNGSFSLLFLLRFSLLLFSAGDVNRG